MSGVLGFIQEHGAVRVVDALLGSVREKSCVLRDGSVISIAVEKVVAGDVVLLAAGDVVPGDGRLLDANALLLDESSLTGESVPRHKRPGTVAPASMCCAPTRPAR
jgi:Mg2+-importing ATPase